MEQWQMVRIMYFRLELLLFKVSIRGSCQSPCQSSLSFWLAPRFGTSVRASIRTAVALAAYVQNHSCAQYFRRKDFLIPLFVFAQRAGCSVTADRHVTRELWGGVWVPVIHFIKTALCSYISCF